MNVCDEEVVGECADVCSRAARSQLFGTLLLLQPRRAADVFHNLQLRLQTTREKLTKNSIVTMKNIMEPASSVYGVKKRTKEEKMGLGVAHFGS